MSRGIKFITLMLAVLLLLGASAVLAENGAGITVVDVLDREVNIPAEVEKVVITFNFEEYFAVTGAAGVDKLVGYSHGYWEGRREDAWATYTTAYPQLLDIADVGYNDNINVEAIIALEPDVVLMSAPVNYTFMETQLDKFDAAGIPVVFFNFHAQTLEMHRASMELIGKVMGDEARGKEIADYYEEQMNLVYDRIAGLPEDAERPSVYMEFSMGPGQYGNTWSTRMWGALIAQCGGRNIAADLGDANSVEIAPEQIIAENPDIIIFTASPRNDVSDNVVLGYGADAEAARAALRSYETRTGWDSLNAIQNGRLSGIYHDLSRHIFDFAGTQFLAKQIHPELFADVDPEANLADFFARYMPVELDGVWTVALEDA